MSKRPLIALTAAAATLLAAQTSFAADESAFSANIALTSKYKFRGQDQSDDTKAVLPAVQGGFDFESGGLYLGNWNSSVGFLGGTEMDFYGGYTGEASGISYDIGLLYYYYPGSDSSVNTLEAYASVGMGGITAKYSNTLSSKWFGIPGGRNSGYLELNGEFELSKDVTLIGHVGTTRFSSGAKNQGAVNYVDYKVGVGYELSSGFALEAAYVGATKKADWGDLNKSRFVLTLSKSL